jgi:hypothetical protein
LRHGLESPRRRAPLRRSAGAVARRQSRELFDLFESVWPGNVDPLLSVARGDIDLSE